MTSALGTRIWESCVWGFIGVAACLVVSKIVHQPSILVQSLTVPSRWQALNPKP